MFSLETIRSMNADAARKTRNTRKKPLVLKDAAAIQALFEHRGGKIPFFGDAVDDVKAEVLANLFCDTSGFGSPDEPALTIPQLIARLAQLVADGPIMIAQSEQGQFQGSVRVWRSPKAKRTT